MPLFRKRTIKDIRLYWKSYVLQTILATAVIFLVLIFFSIEKEPVIIASLSATAFIVFAMPKSVMARPRNVLGGHLVGIICGSIGYLLYYTTFTESPTLCSLAYALVTGLSILIMVVTDTEHPPASGTALGVAIGRPSVQSLVTLIISIIVILLVHRLSRKRLKDLT
jgi:CBS domain-containing membrane protein